VKIEYTNNIPSTDQYFALFETTGWNREYLVRSDELARAVANSQYVVTAYDGEKLIGFGRVVTDGVLHAMLYDMIVHPDYQGRGIGTNILGMLVKWCNEMHIRDVQLFCARGKSAFYGKSGFNPRPGDAPGMSYMRQKENPKSRR
jgi:GNAT superfamily N-acetyltransferase